MEPSPLRLGFLASHNGTDMQAIVYEIEQNGLNATAEALITNNSKSVARLFAQEHKIPNYHISSKTHDNPNEAITEVLLHHGIELVICSGYMKSIGGKLLGVYKDKIWNPHPADPTKYGGLYGNAVHETVLASGDEYTFPTIHLVDEGIDTGKILAQGKVQILRDDTVETLKSRVQKEEISLFLNLLHSQTTSS